MMSIRERKREIVHRAGKRLLRAVGDFQARHSMVSTEPILPNREFPWVPQLESEWRNIRAELDSVLTRPEDIPAFHQISPDQRRISKDDHWKTFALYIFRHPIQEELCAVPVDNPAPGRIAPTAKTPGFPYSRHTTRFHRTAD